MNFNQWYGDGTDYEINGGRNHAESGWKTCKIEILKLLEQNKELESISYSGKEKYKIYGTVIEKIKNEI